MPAMLMPLPLQRERAIKGCCCRRFTISLPRTLFISQTFYIADMPYIFIFTHYDVYMLIYCFSYFYAACFAFSATWLFRFSFIFRPSIRDIFFPVPYRLLHQRTTSSYSVPLHSLNTDARVQPPLMRERHFALMPRRRHADDY